MNESSIFIKKSFDQKILSTLFILQSTLFILHECFIVCNCPILCITPEQSNLNLFKKGLTTENKYDE